MIKVEFLPLEIIYQLKDFKYPIFKCFFVLIKKSIYYTVKMQTKRFSPFIQKLKYYASHIHSNQLFKDTDSLKINPLILLIITNLIFFLKKINTLVIITMMKRKQINASYQILYMYLLNSQNSINVKNNLKLIGY